MSPFETNTGFPILLLAKEGSGCFPVLWYFMQFFQSYLFFTLPDLEDLGFTLVSATLVIACFYRNSSEAFSEDLQVVLAEAMILAQQGIIFCLVILNLIKIYWC